MKKLLTIISLIVMSLGGYAQRGGAPNWISIAAKGGYGNSIFFSKQASDLEGYDKDVMAPSYCFGGRLGVVFIDKVGVSLEYLGSNYESKYSYNTGIVDLEGNMKMKAGDLLALFRYTGEYGFYCELGPKFTSVKEVTREFETQVGKASAPGIEEPVTDLFKGKFTSVVFGFGFMPYNGDRVQISLGLRAAYCNKNVLETQDNIFGFKEMIPTQTVEIKPFSAQVMLEVNYHFARFGTATCGKQKIIFFK